MSRITTLILKWSPPELDVLLIDMDLGRDVGEI